MQRFSDIPEDSTDLNSLFPDQKNAGELRETVLLADASRNRSEIEATKPVARKRVSLAVWQGKPEI
jgi:hypothetical protein